MRTVESQSINQPRFFSVAQIETITETTKVRPILGATTDG